MVRKSGLVVEKEILLALSSGEKSMRELERVVNTNYATIRAHCNVLSFYGLIAVVDHQRSDANGRPYTTAELTASGRKIVERILKEKTLTR